MLVVATAASPEAARGPLPHLFDETLVVPGLRGNAEVATALKTSGLLAGDDDLADDLGRLAGDMPVKPLLTIAERAAAAAENDPNMLRSLFQE